MKSPLKVSDVMSNARAITIDSVILLFYIIYLNGQKLRLSVIVVLLPLLFNMHTTNAIRKRFLFTEKNKDLLTINHKPAETKSFDGVTFWRKILTLYKSLITWFWKNLKKGVLWPICANPNCILCICKYVCVSKMEC